MNLYAMADRLVEKLTQRFEDRIDAVVKEIKTIIRTEFDGICKEFRDRFAED